MPSINDYRDVVAKHYKEQAFKEGHESTSTMPDFRVRELENKAIDLFLENFSKGNSILEIGCGNGLNLSRIAKQGYKNLEGMDFCREFVELANQINPNSKIIQADCADLPYEDNTFDLIISQRVIINLLNRDDQKKAIEETLRVLKPKGNILFIEGFEEPNILINKLRSEFGLKAIPQPFHNMWFVEEEFISICNQYCEIINNHNINDIQLKLNYHYFVSRFFHDLLRDLKVDKNEELQKKLPIRNSVFVECLNSLSNPLMKMNISPIKVYWFNKLS